MTGTTAADDASKFTYADLLAARTLAAKGPVRERLVISPRGHATACRLLGLPEGSPLTEAQVYEAALIELRDLPPSLPLSRSGGTE